MLRDLYGEKRSPCSQREVDLIAAGHKRYLTKSGGARAQFVSVTLDGLRLADYQFPEADFAGASLVGANLSRANLERASFYCADLRKADLRHANLRNSDMRGASFKGANLSFAALDNADLRAAMMMQMLGPGRRHRRRPRRSSEQAGSATGGERGVDFSNCSMKGICFANANLKRREFQRRAAQRRQFPRREARGCELCRGGHQRREGPGGTARGAERRDRRRLRGNGDALAALRPKLDAHQQWIGRRRTQGQLPCSTTWTLRPLHKHFAGGN
jgi:uncharacterized protein YjbI with pentapeptide repeats